MNNLVSGYYEPQINSDERRFVNLNIQHFSEVNQRNSILKSTQRAQSSAFTTYEKAASRLRTRIGRIFTDTHNLCASVKSVFHPIKKIKHISGFIMSKHFGAIEYLSRKGDAL